MTRTISSQTARILRASLPVVKAHKLPIIAGMTDSLAAADPGRGKAWAERAATSLVDLVIEQAHHLARGAEPEGLDSVRLEQVRNDIDRFHHTRFGDALVAVMLDAAGTALPRQIGGVWCEAFWVIITHLNRVEQNSISRHSARSVAARQDAPALAGA